MDVKRLIHTLRYCSFFRSTARGEYVKKKHIFGAVGDKVRLPQMILPLRCENIFFHNNIEIASGAKLTPHDAIHSVFNNMEGSDGKYHEHVGRIEIFDNVFIGANVIILGSVNIGPNAVVAAGAVVTKDVPPNTCVGWYRPRLSVSLMS